MVIYSGLGDIKEEILNCIEEETSSREFVSVDQLTKENLNNCSLVILGPSVQEPVKAVQKIYATDKQVGVIIFADKDYFKEIKQSLQFAPFVGKNASCVLYAREINAPAIIKNAILRTRQRRSFNRIVLPQTNALVSAPSMKLEQLGSFLNQAPIAAILIDAHKNIVALNERATAIFSVKKEDKDVTLKELFPDVEDAHIDRIVEPEEEEDRIITVSTGGRILERTSSEVYNNEGKKYILLLLNDVTEKHEEEKRIRTILEALPQMAWTTDEKGITTFLTQGWFDYTGQSKEEAYNNGWAKVIHPVDLDEVANKWRKVLDTGKELTFEARYKRNDGVFRWHLTKAVPVRNASGKVFMWVGTCTDIEDQKQHAQELEIKVKERTRELEESNSELEQFAYVSSHDLQEPLRKIRLFSEMLKESAYDSVNQQSKKYIEKISETALRMSTSLKDLLHFTQLQRHEKFVTTDLETIISQVKDDLELIISQKRARIICDKMPVIQAIPIQMHQLFYNLVNNALKFSKAGIDPEINITVNEKKYINAVHEESTYYEIVVKDNGIGFDPAYAEQIFQIFQRLHNRTLFSGTGIGLALCKKVVQNHNGEIYAESEPGKGAAFHILLPEKQLN